MSAALDLGTLDCRLLVRRGDRLASRSLAPIFCTLPDRLGDASELQGLEPPLVRSGDETLVLGESARDVARLFPTPLQTLFNDGLVPTGEMRKRQLLAGLLEHLLPAPTTPGEPCAVVLPTGMPRSAERAKQFLCGIVRLKGFEPHPISVCEAVCLSEMAPVRYTGLVVHAGASGTRVGVVRHSHLVDEVVLPQSRERLELELATAHGLTHFTSEGRPIIDRPRVSRWLTGQETDLDLDRILPGPVQSALATWTDAVQKAVSELDSVSDNLPVVLSGCSLSLPAFRIRLAETFQNAQGTRTILTASTAATSIARGGLIRVALEDQAVTQERRAA